MTYYSTTTRVYRDYEGERRQESTIAHVTRGWFPCDPETLATIQSNYDDGVYSDDTESLLLSLKRDPATLAKVLSRLPAEFVKGDLTQNLLQLGSDRIMRLVPRTSVEVSRASLRLGTPFSRTAWATTVTSTCASESFALEAERRGVVVNANDAFPATLLRQIGLNLLAWNYPALLSRVARSARGDDVAFDAQFEKLVGLSPLMLSRRVVQGWNIPAEVTRTLANPLPYERPNELRTLCEFGELFAKRQHKSLFPLGPRQWEERKEQLLALVGAQSVREVEERVEHDTHARLVHMLKRAPEQLNPTFAVIRESKTSVWVTNPFVAELSIEAQQEFEAVYEALKHEPRSIEALSRLTQRVLPATGFVRGVICVESERSVALTPTVRIGLSRGDNATLALLTDAAEDSRESAVPMLSEVTDLLESNPTGKSGTRIASSFKSNHFKGALVLELASSEAPNNQLKLFKAVRSCLEHCLA